MSNSNRRANKGWMTFVVALAAILAAAALPTAAEAGRGHHHVGGGHYYGHVPYWGWGGYTGWGYYGPYYGWGGGWGGYPVVYPMADRTHGALDIDVSPEQAQVYVDGQLAGTADDFDGFPNYLWLENGAHDIVIFHAGFQTISRQISIYGGQVIDVEDRMTPGQETLPEDLVSRSTANRDERLRRERELEAETSGAEQGDWNQGEEPRAEARTSRAYRDELDARGEPGRAILRVAPDDASVYLDGRFLGTGSDLGRLRSGLIVDPGNHEIEAVRPGRESAKIDFSVEPGKEVHLVLELKPEE